MAKQSRPQLVALPPGTTQVTIDGTPTPDGEVHFTSEPAFALIRTPEGLSAVGILDHEVPLGTHGPRHSPLVTSLVPAGTSPEDLQGFVGATYQQTWGPPPPPPAPDALTGVVTPPEAAPPPDVPDFLASAQGAQDGADAPTEVLEPVTTPQRPPRR